MYERHLDPGADNGADSLCCRDGISGRNRDSSRDRYPGSDRDRNPGSDGEFSRVVRSAGDRNAGRDRYASSD